jgi:hypothetical protein
VTHLQPEAWRVDAGDRVVLAPHDASGALAWQARPFEWLFVRGAGTQANHDALPEKTDPEAPDFVVAPGASDTWLVGVELDPRVEPVAPKDWSAFLRARVAGGQDLARSIAPRPLRVRHVESCKALLVVRDAEGRSGSSGTSMGKTGQRMELRPLADPCTTTPGGALPLRLYVPEGLPVSQLLVARQLLSGEELRATFDAQGYAHVELPSAGPWVLEVHAVRRTAQDTAAEWELFTTTLAFEAPPVPPKEKPADESGDGREEDR